MGLLVEVAFTGATRMGILDHDVTLSGRDGDPTRCASSRTIVVARSSSHFSSDRV